MLLATAKAEAGVTELGADAFMAEAAKVQLHMEGVQATIGLALDVMHSNI